MSLLSFACKNRIILPFWKNETKTNKAEVLFSNRKKEENTNIRNT